MDWNGKAMSEQKDGMRERVVKALLAHKMVVMCDEEGDPAALIDYLGLDGASRPGVAMDEINAIADSVCAAINEIG